MADGETTGLQFGEQRLDVAQHGFAGSGIAVMAECRIPRQRGYDGLGIEVITDMAKAAVGKKLPGVMGYDTGGLLPPVLQGMQSQHRIGGGIRAADDAEDAAFLVKLVTVGGINIVGMRRQVQIGCPWILAVGGALFQLSVRFWIRRFMSSREPWV